MQSKPVGRVEHKAADQMYVDFAGDRLSITDPISGQSTPVDVFVAILPCSHYTFCKAVASQRKEDFIGACEDALRSKSSILRKWHPGHIADKVFLKKSKKII